MLDPGQVGVCKVRRGSAGGGLETATFASSVTHIDAMERKPFFHYRPGTPTITLAAPGCSFRCDYCVNFRISQYGRDDESVWNVHPVEADEIVARAAAMGGAVALSYTEPSLAPELTLELARHGRDVGVEVVWKSNGFLTLEAIALCAPAVAAVNIDVKGTSPGTWYGSRPRTGCVTKTRRPRRPSPRRPTPAEPPGSDTYTSNGLSVRRAGPPGARRARLPCCAAGYGHLQRTGSKPGTARTAEPSSKGVGKA